MKGIRMSIAQTRAIWFALAAMFAMLCSPLARAEGDPAPTYQREAAMQKYKGCHFTNEMGKYLYECVKKNDGFGTHWCYDETLETYCPAQLEETKRAAEAAATSGKPAN
jgi:hypothetical protein